MALATGAKLGPYEIVSRIGKGGMGEVWKARDPRLNRDVGIKISAQQFTDRFEREARDRRAESSEYLRAARRRPELSGDGVGGRSDAG
jgi:serine/threonine protein kinase